MIIFNVSPFIWLSFFLPHPLKPSHPMCISFSLSFPFLPFFPPLSPLSPLINLFICLSPHITLLSSSSSCLPLVLLLPPSNLSSCSVSTLPSLLFSWSVRHNQPLVSGLAWLWRSATCFSSSFSCCLGFVPSASNRLFRVWDRLFLTLPSLGATGLSLSKRPDFLAWRVWVYLCVSDFSMRVYVRACASACVCIFVFCCRCFFSVPLILCNHFETIP